jgi:phospholipid/cholesterol/gamma-HCH transport system ATP-binding protein
MIEIIGLKRSFNSKKVLDGVDLAIERGKITVIIGRSGEGKSVLIKHIIGLSTSACSSRAPHFSTP